MMNFLNGFTFHYLDLASDTPLLIRNTTEIIFLQISVRGSRMFILNSYLHIFYDKERTEPKV